MANEERELEKFVNDPRYREKVMERVRRDADRDREKQIKELESECTKLSKIRTNEIKKITKSRWEKAVGGNLVINRTEGKIKINDTECLFSSIKGAKLHMESAHRTVTTGKINSKEKNHASLGGAAAGAFVGGVPGAIIGGTVLGKTKTKTTGSTTSNQIPTCTHLGVLVNIDGFTSEITLLSSQVDQSSWTFQTAESNAQKIIALLGTLAHTPVPENILKPEEEPSVRLLDEQLLSKQRELEAMNAQNPIYELPEMYRTDEQRNLSDDEYLRYLQQMDRQRSENNAENRRTVMPEPTVRNMSQWTVASEQASQNVNHRNAIPEREVQNADQQAAAFGTTERVVSQRQTGHRANENLQKVGNAIYNIAFWVFSLMNVLFSVYGFSKSWISGTLFLATALIINPKMNELVWSKKVELPKWSMILILIVGFFAGVLTFPAAQ